MFVAPTYDLAIFTPFTLLPPVEEEGGILVGTDRYGRNVYLNPERLPNFHGIILGPTGSGKSTTVESLLYDLREHGINVLCIDPHQDYVEAVKDLGGVVVDVSEKIPNPLENPSGNSEASISLWGEYVSKAARYSVDLREDEESALRLMMEDVMREGGGVGDLLDTLEYARDSAPALYTKCRDLFGFFREPNFSITQLLRSSRPAAIAYGLKSRVPGYIEKFATLLLINQLNEYFISRVRPDERCRARVVVVVDEAWRLLKMPGYEADFLNRIREMRKFGVAYWIITQSATDMPLEAYEQFGFTLALSGPKMHAVKLDAIQRLSRDDIEWLMFNRRPGYAVLLRTGYPKAAQIRVRVRDEVLERRQKR